MLKVALAGVIVAAFTAWLGDTAAAILLYGGAATTLAVAVRKVLIPLIRLADRLGDLPAYMKQTHEHFERIEDRLDALEQPAVDAAEKATAVARRLGVQWRSEPRDE